MFNSRYTRVALLFSLLLALAVVALPVLRGPRLPVYEVEALPLVQNVVATGRVESVSRSQVGVQITGVVLERRVQEGDKVRPGDLLLLLRSDDLQAQLREAEAALDQLANATRPQAELALARAESRLDQARREAQRRRELNERGLLSKEALEQAEEEEIITRNAVEAARVTAVAAAPGSTEEALLNARVASLQAELEKTRVRAEVAGTVLTRDVEPGDLVQPGKILFTIARQGATEVVVPLDEKNLSQLAQGQAASVIADAFPTQPFPARVSFIAPRVDPQRGTVDVHLTMAAMPDFLREDMTVTATIETGSRDRTVAIPNSAMLATGADSARVIKVESGKLEHTEVGLGLRGVGLSEVTSGLQAGDRILANPEADMADGTRVRVLLQPLPARETRSSPNSSNEVPIQLQ